MAFYKIVANNPINSESSESDVKTADTLIGHINSEQIGNKYVYVIHFDHNIDSNQQLTDCSLQSTNESSINCTKNENAINFNVKTIEELTQLLNNNNDNNVDNNINKIDEPLNDSKFENFNPNVDLKQDYEQIDNNNRVNENVTKSKHTMSLCEDLRPFVCQWPHCHKRFNRKGILITHMRTHTGERPFRCDYTLENGSKCGKSFNQICVLKNHKRTHTGERPYVCDWADFSSGKLCGHSFKTSGSLHHHRMNHEGKQHQTIKKFNKISAKFVANNKVNKNKSNKTVETVKNNLSEKIHKNNNISGNTGVKSNAFNETNREKYTQYSKITENRGKNSYECNFENCHQKFARKCALINHFNYRHQSDCY